jgi:peptidyl-prolyl cis-trans isomerase SurA
MSDCYLNNCSSFSENKGRRETSLNALPRGAPQHTAAARLWTAGYPCRLQVQMISMFKFFTQKPKRTLFLKQVNQPLLQLLLALVLLASPIQAEVVDRVVAEVNDDLITLSEIEDAARGMLKRVALEVPAQDRLEAINQVRQEVLQNLIDKKLIEQEAEKQQIVVSELEVDAAFEQVLRANNISRQDLLEELKQNGLDEVTYRDNLRTQIYQTQLVNRDVRSKIVITEEVILDYYDTRYTKHIKEGSYYLLQIGIGWGETEGLEQDPTATDEQKQAAYQKAERVHKLARSGQDFRELARKFSDLPSASEGGDIGVFEEEEMASYMRNAVTSLNPGEVSPIIETPVGYQFFKLLSSKEGGIVMQAPYDSVKEDIREQLYREALQKDFQNWIDDIRQRAYIRVSL